MPVSFNVPSAPASFYNTVIEREIYLFRFKWNVRAQSWYIDIETNTGDILAKAAKLVPNNPLIRSNFDKGPSGNLYIIATTDDATAIPGRNNIGPRKDFELVYLTEEELVDVS